MKNTTLEFITSVLEIPAYTHYEGLMKDFIKSFATEQKISTYEDAKGNLYLTKGTLSPNEYYPCMTAHLDNVQFGQKSYVQENKKIPLIVEEISEGHLIRCPEFGVGADDKTGIVVCLELLKKRDVLKVAFFVEEEAGMLGSTGLDKNWFKDVGYVIGVDSPEQNRASFSSNGLPIMSSEFLQLIQPLCEKHHVTRFNHEPYTDVYQIRKQLGLTCMNFGSGGYYPHSDMDCAIAEDIDKCIALCSDLINSLGKIKINEFLIERFVNLAKEVATKYQDVLEFLGKN